MRCRHVKPFEIPLHLLEQKKIWNLEVFYRMAATATHWYAFVCSDGDDDIGAFILYDDPLYDSVALQTVIVDKAHRTYETVA